MDKRAFITGGSGFVGGRLIKMLVANGWRVRAIGRSAQALNKVRDGGAEPVESDLADAASLRRAMTGCTAVFHAAALFRLWGKPQDFADVNVTGTTLLLDVARDAGVQRFVQIGASAVVMGDPVPPPALSPTPTPAAGRDSTEAWDADAVGTPRGGIISADLLRAALLNSAERGVDHG